MAERRTVSAREALDFLGARSKSRQLDPPQLELRKAYRQAAAVLVGISDVASLNPLGSNLPGGSAGPLLGDDLVLVRRERVDGDMMLSADVRRTALRELVDAKALGAALDVNPQERFGPMQAAFEAYLTGKAKPIEEQSSSELEDTLQILLWLDGVPLELPSLNDVRRRLEYLRLLAPLESLAGDSVFSGRQRELDSLRSFIGVLPPASLLSRIADRAFAWAKPVQQPALCVFGPGGVGKSALVARFMLEHTRLTEAARIPFAYLDFDRPSLDIANPLTLCIEMIRQLCLQFPTQESFTRLRDFAAARPTSDPGVNQLQASHSILADLLGSIESRLGPRPYVVTLDTFEEVQYRGEASAFPFWELLANLQQARPFLRVVVSGRAPANGLLLSGRSAFDLEIGDLDKAAAIAFLQAKGVDDPGLAARIVGQVGGVPLSLKLAASLVEREGAEAKGIRDLSGRSSFWFSASDEMIQGQLFERILGHIHHPQVERLAHPGLVMRRITPEVILYVLNAPCSLGVTSLDEARSLFEELRKETALVVVSQDEESEALAHRPDLRRIMLKLLVQKAPAQVAEIHRRAVEWYSMQPGLRASAESLYHRLQLGEKVEASAFANREVRFSIQTAIAELPVESQLLLAVHGFDVSKEILERASRDQAEAAMAARIEDLLPYGPSSVNQAVAIARQEVMGLSAPSPLFRAAARAALQRGDIASAIDLVEQGLSLSLPANNTMQTLDLLREKAWALQGMAGEQGTLDELKDYAERHRDASATFQHRTQLYATLRGAGTQPSNAGSPAWEALNEIAGLLPRLDGMALWGLLPAMRLAMPRLVIDHREVVPLVRARLIEDGGPFRLASFADSTVNARLEQLLTAAVNRWQIPDLDPLRDVAAPFERLLAVWPYRVLRVPPPYGSRGGRRLSEAL